MISVCNHLLDVSSLSDISKVDLFVKLIVIISTSKKLGNCEVRELSLRFSLMLTERERLRESVVGGQAEDGGFRRKNHRHIQLVFKNKHQII